MVVGRQSLSTDESGSLTVAVSKSVIHEKWNSNQLAQGFVLSGCTCRVGWQGHRLGVGYLTEKSGCCPILCSFCREGGEGLGPKDAWTGVWLGVAGGNLDLLPVKSTGFPSTPGTH